MVAAIWLVCGAEGLRAQSLLTNTTPVGFFTNAADLMLRTTFPNPISAIYTNGDDANGLPILATNWAQLSITNIPIYPANFYTPAVHRLLQLAANMYDASTNRVFEDGTSPNGPYYPSVFRPTFSSDGTNVFITGYVEDVAGGTGSNKNYLILPLSLPEDLALVDTNTINIYGIPWVIGARKGFPNFNEITMQCFSQITRAVQIVKPSLSAPQSTWVTNIRYSIGISNVIGVEAWNSYSNAYSRAIDIIGVDTLSMYLTNELGILVATNFIPSNPTSPGLFFGPTSTGTMSISPAGWSGFNLTLSRSNPKYAIPSFQIPLFTNVIFLANQAYHPNVNPRLNFDPNFDQNTGFLQPSFGLNITNKLRFLMVDHATGRLLDFEQFGGMNFHRDLTGDLNETNLGSNPGGIWVTNRVNDSNSAIVGVVNQILVSRGITNIPPYLPITPSDWINDQLQHTSEASALAAFNNFMNGADTTNLSMEAPFIPTRFVSIAFTWQANDPLVHSMLSDMNLPWPLGVTTNFLPPSTTNTALTNFASINFRYMPWGNIGNYRGVSADPTNAYNLAVKDPFVVGSDSWQFSTNGFPSLAWLANVHRGTPWQTVYLKSATTSLSNWAYWTGDSIPNDALFSEPINDWNLVAALLPALTPADPHSQYGYNNPNAATLFPAFEGLTVFTNVSNSILSPIVIDDVANSNAIAQVIAGINATRATLPGGVFTNIGQILATPQLTLLSPFINPNFNTSSSSLTDSVVEALAAQLLPLLRPDSIGTVMNTGGQPTIQFTGIDGYGYFVQTSTNLQDWTTVATLYPTNGILNFTDTNTIAAVGKYYRTVLAP